jgi:hypothetical protein
MYENGVLQLKVIVYIYQPPFQVESAKATFSVPYLDSVCVQYSTMLVRPVATDKRAFYLLNTTDSGPQV